MFHFACPQWPNLVVWPLQVRFTDGFFNTDDADLANRLRDIEGVVLVEGPAALTPVENAPAVEETPLAPEPTLAELEAELAALRAELAAEHNQEHNNP